MELLRNFPQYHFEVSRLTCGNTHGDYQISQLLWKDNRIAGVIDWTCACVHPYIWEIVRSYIFMATECKNGEIDIEALIQYIKEYQSIAPLNRYDVENAGNLFYYFLAVCDFYGQYYQAHSRNRGNLSGAGRSVLMRRAGKKQGRRLLLDWRNSTVGRVPGTIFIVVQLYIV